ncbi:MAG: (CDP-alcohol) phosphatidyltransferase [Candidatus Magnetoglobus multicellularis str. Araruama]|uniref:Phosphatidylcholine synthase n=1 Tax=Candidatus Magnetoglobus multicellularis str. Araruama TaxID=890399 RepID=A0A1V1PHM0_9BACT|nr:MAG: (CDP-alcohol) phosphatidyltransferase [Candidatus Magnetoglobus multicellularis str. Araruama]
MSDQPNFNQNQTVSGVRKISAWMVHVFTATGAVFSLLALHEIYWWNFKLAFWYMAIAIFIDSIDGFMARKVRIKEAVPGIDGAMLDNIIDYVNYVIVPAFFFIESDLLPFGFRIVGAGIIAIASSYQFSQIDAKTSDHFFKGFPSYWNIVAFYLFIWNQNPWFNFAIIVLLGVLIFVPIKYAYLSRPHFLIQNNYLRTMMLAFSLLWAFSAATLLWIHPKTNAFFAFIILIYIFVYFGISLYRTFVPVKTIET